MGVLTVSLCAHNLARKLRKQAHVGAWHIETKRQQRISANIKNIREESLKRTKNGTHEPDFNTFRAHSHPPKPQFSS